MATTPFSATPDVDWVPVGFEFEPEDLGHGRGVDPEDLEAWSTAIATEGKAAGDAAPWFGAMPATDRDSDPLVGELNDADQPVDHGIDDSIDQTPDRGIESASRPNRRTRNRPPTRHRKRRADAPNPRQPRLLDGKNGAQPRVYNPTTDRYHAVSQRHSDLLVWLLRVGYATNQQVQRQFWDRPVNRTTSQRVLARLVETGFLSQTTLNGESVYFPTGHAVAWANRVDPARIATGPMRNLGAGRTEHTLMLTDLVIQIERNGWGTPLGINRPTFVTEREIDVTDAAPKLTAFEAKARDAAAKHRGPEPLTRAEHGLAKAARRQGLDQPRTAVWSLPRANGTGFHRPDMMLWEDFTVNSVMPAGIPGNQWAASRIAVEVEESAKTLKEYIAIMRTYARANQAGLIRGVVYVSTQPGIRRRVIAAAQHTGTEHLLFTQHQPDPGLWAAWPGKDEAVHAAIGPITSGPPKPTQAPTDAPRVPTPTPTPAPASEVANPWAGAPTVEVLPPAAPPGMLSYPAPTPGTP